MGDLNGATTWLKICFFTRFSFIYFNFSFLYQWYSDLKHKSDWDSKKEPFFYLLFISYFFCMKKFLIFISYTILLSFYGLEIYNTPIFDTFFGGIPLFTLGWSFLFSSKRNLILLFLKILNYSNKIQLISQNCRIVDLFAKPDDFLLFLNNTYMINQNLLFFALKNNFRLV